MGKPTIYIGENKGAFVFATRIVQFLLYLTSKFQASSLLRSVSVGPVRKPHCWVSHEVAHILIIEKKCRSSSQNVKSPNGAANFRC